MSARRVLATGGSRGIGAAIGRRIAARRAEVVLIYRVQDDAAAWLVAECHQGLARQYDLTRCDPAALLADFGHFDSHFTSASAADSRDRKSEGRRGPARSKRQSLSVSGSLTKSRRATILLSEEQLWPPVLCCR